MANLHHDRYARTLVIGAGDISLSRLNLFTLRNDLQTLYLCLRIPPARPRASHLAIIKHTTRTCPTTGLTAHRAPPSSLSHRKAALARSLAVLRDVERRLDVQEELVFAPTLTHGPILPLARPSSAQ